MPAGWTCRIRCNLQTFKHDAGVGLARSTEQFGRQCVDARQASPVRLEGSGVPETGGSGWTIIASRSTCTNPTPILLYCSPSWLGTHSPGPDAVPEFCPPLPAGLLPLKQPQAYTHGSPLLSTSQAALATARLSSALGLGALPMTAAVQNRGPGRQELAVHLSEDSALPYQPPFA